MALGSGGEQALVDDVLTCRSSRTSRTRHGRLELLALRHQLADWLGFVPIAEAGTFSPSTSGLGNHHA